MKRVRIDFAPSGLRRTLWRAPPAAWVLSCAALVGGIALAQAAGRYRDDAAVLAHRVARAEALARPRVAPGPAPRAPLAPAQADAVNAAVLQLNLPWRALHDAVQAATPAAIALLALEPDAKKSRLRITAEAANSEDMLAYIEALRRIDWFAGVALLRHETDEQDPNRPIRFQVDAAWKAAP